MAFKHDWDIEKSMSPGICTWEPCFESDKLRNGESDKCPRCPKFSSVPAHVRRVRSGVAAWEDPRRLNVRVTESLRRWLYDNRSPEAEAEFLRQVREIDPRAEGLTVAEVLSYSHR